jgi:photosystem II stability/assembly factor-like uncharacterized protein
MEPKNPSSFAQPTDYIFQLAAPATFDRGGEEIYFSARTSGLFRSGDGGKTWESAYASLEARQTLPTTAIALAPDFIHEPTVFAGLNGAILRSYDGGINWQRSRMPTPPPAISALVVSPDFSEDGMVFAGTNEDGVLVSTDRGQSWVSWNFGLLDLNILCLAISPDFSADETVYAGAESGLFRSTNGGRAWKEVTLPIGFDAVISLANSPRFAQDNTLFVGTENKGLLISRDRGISWSQPYGFTSEAPVNQILFSPASQTSKEMLMLHGGTILVSSNGGKTWKPWQVRKLGGRNITAVLAHPGIGKEILVGFEDGSTTRI